MGMYTEVYIRCALKKTTPDSVIDILKHMFDAKESHALARHFLLPDHPFFKCARWNYIGSSSSHYFTPYPTSRMKFDNISKQWYITSRSDLKNYDGEVGKFFDWILPYVEWPSGQMIGYSLYEEDKIPTIYCAL